MEDSLDFRVSEMEDVDGSLFVVVDVVLPDQAFTVLQTHDARPLSVVYLVVLDDRVRVRPDVYTCGTEGMTHTGTL